MLGVWDLVSIANVACGRHVCADGCDGRNIKQTNKQKKMTNYQKQITKYKIQNNKNNRTTNQ